MFKTTGTELFRTGAMTALALTIHNFPEGLATFVTALGDPEVAIPVAAAIALHNVPEGIAVAMPMYYATGNRKRALGYSFASGLAEPLGAVIGYLLLRNFLSDTLFGVIFAAVAGIMVFISIDELLPSAHEYGEHHLSIYGFIGGMAVMAISLIVL
jgi:ZIP family zinc transporter